MAVDASEGTSTTMHAEAVERSKQLLSQGYIVLKNAIAESDCDALLSHVLASTDEARRLGRGDLFGNIQETEHRADLKLDLCAPVIEALNQVSDCCGPIWTQVMSERVKFVELAAITSDPGSVCQPVHADTMHGVTRFLQGEMSLPAQDPGAEEDEEDAEAAHDDLTHVVRAIATDTAMIYTCLVALQDVEPDMGPTHVWPGTNTVEHHATLWGSDVSGKLYAAEADKAFGVEHKDMTLKKGDLVMYDSRTMHCGGANTSSKRRSVLVVSTMGPGIRPDGTTWTLLRSLRNRLQLSNMPLSLEMAPRGADASSGSIELPAAEELVVDDPVNDGYSQRAIPPLKDWEAAVQCAFCRQWRPCAGAEAPKLTGSTNGFSCTLIGFSCLQEQKYTKDEIDEAFE